ncbi:Myotubularin-related protein 2 [Acropora cervicornis]|uniref:Myotubularin-related protein 2 n=1 Tax=Acropora cervicornis TaxID=6130 RepID=A0AAD9VAU8_ACRCE|nr:Myotubularin-related protein 2 [Acropora cervicornis]
MSQSVMSSSMSSAVLTAELDVSSFADATFAIETPDIALGKLALLCKGRVFFLSLLINLHMVSGGSPSPVVDTTNTTSDSFSKPAKVTPHERFYSHPPLLPGELITSQYDYVTCIDTFNYFAKGVLHVTTYRIIFAGTKDSLDQAQTRFTDAEPEEVARRGHHYQTRSRHASIHAKLHDVWRYDKAESNTNKRGLRHSQSMIRKSPVNFSLPGDDSCVKLQTMRPMRPVLHNIEHVYHNYEVVASIPLTSICEVKRFSKRNLPKDKQMFLMDGFEIICSSIQSHRFCLGSQTAVGADTVMKVIARNSEVLFCFSHKFSILLPQRCDILDKKDTPNFYNFESELDRLNLFPSANWRITSKLDDRHPLQYPSETVVPRSITSEELIDVANFHRAECFPAVCWRHVDNGAVLLRSATSCFRRGLRDSRCQADEKYLIAVCSCNQAPTNKLVVFTEQVRQFGGGLLNSSQTQMTGQLTPEEGETFFYPNTKFIYGDGLPDFKAVKQSSIKLQAVLSSKSDDSKWLSALDDTDWLSQISELLQTATQISVAMENDRSSVLIQKEWLSFGHKFYARSVSPKQSDELSPVFLQWLDCVWQVLQQFPFSFEFNSLLLEVIAEHVYSSRFGTFIANSKNERDEIRTNLSISDSKTAISEALHPEYRITCLKLWSSLYLDRYRKDHVQDALKAAELELIKLEEKCKDRLDKYSQLLRRLAEVDSEDVSSKVSFYTATLSRALGKNHPRNHLVPLPNESNNLLTASGSSATDGSSLDEEEPDVMVSSSTTIRRMTRSRSLDDMLNVDMRQRKVLKKQASLKRRVGSSKFYTEEMLNVLNKESTNDVRKLPISEKYNGLKDYLDSTEVRKSWKKRWFVLDLNKKYLAYFETEKAESPKGAISFNTITRVYEHQNCGKSKRPFRFCVDTPDRTYTINAPSERSMNIWIMCLNISPSAIQLQRDQT